MSILNSAESFLPKSGYLAFESILEQNSEMLNLAFLNKNNSEPQIMGSGQ
jgi:hypothetical protein